MEGARIVLEAFPSGKAALQREEHHRPLGTAHGKRYTGLHPHGAAADQSGGHGESAATIAGRGHRTVG